MKPMKIDQYTTVTDFTTAGSGSAMWCFAKGRSGEDVFLKKFLSPVLPSNTASLSEHVRKRKIAVCQGFYNKKKAVYDTVNRAGNNNIIAPYSIFAHEGHYYAVSKRVHMKEMTIEEISLLPKENVLLLMRVMAHSLMQLEAQGVVHADIKPDNFLLKKTEGGMYTLKLIDFDASFLISDPPLIGEDVQCDMVYVAPETFRFMMEEEVQLTSKADVFAFAIIMHQMLTGKLPTFSSQYSAVYEAVLEGGNVSVDPNIPELYRSLIVRGLDRYPDNRPTMKQIHQALLAGKIIDSSGSSTGTYGLHMGPMPDL